MTMATDPAEATRAFLLNYANDEGLYKMTVGLAVSLLEAKPSIGDDELGRYVVRFYRDLWASGPWKEDSPLARMKGEVVSFWAVVAAEVGASVREDAEGFLIDRT